MWNIAAPGFYASPLFALIFKFLGILNVADVTRPSARGESTASASAAPQGSDHLRKGLRDKVSSRQGHRAHNREHHPPRSPATPRFTWWTHLGTAINAASRPSRPVCHRNPSARQPARAACHPHRPAAQAEGLARWHAGTSCVAQPGAHMHPKGLRLGGSDRLMRCVRLGVSLRAVDRSLQSADGPGALAGSPCISGGLPYCSACRGPDVRQDRLQ